MKLVVSVSPAFGDELLSWQVTFVVGGRGSAHWSGRSDAVGAGSGATTRRGVPPIEEPFFREIASALVELPERYAGAVTEDIGGRCISCVDGSRRISRGRDGAFHSPSFAQTCEPLFQTTWDRCFAHVQPVLIRLGMPETTLDRFR